MPRAIWWSQGVGVFLSARYPYNTAQGQYCRRNYRVTSLIRKRYPCRYEMLPEVRLLPKVRLPLSLLHTHSLTHTRTLSLSLSYTRALSLSLSHTHTLSLSLALSHTHTHTRTHTHRYEMLPEVRLLRGAQKRRPEMLQRIISFN